MKCHGIGRLFGHKYQPRYSESLPDGFELPQPNHIPMGALKLLWGVARKTALSLTYHGDMCTRCGHVVGIQEMRLGDRMIKRFGEAESDDPTP